MILTSAYIAARFCTFFNKYNNNFEIIKGKPSPPSCYVTPGEPLQDVLDRQNEMYADRRRREALEEERRLAELEMWRRNPFTKELQDQWTSSGNKICDLFILIRYENQHPE